MTSLTLYSTGCPQCKVLKAKLQAADIDFVEITDLSILAEKQIIFVPMLDIGDKLLGFSDSIKWIKERLDNAN